jgi:Fic family protein
MSEMNSVAARAMSASAAARLQGTLKHLANTDMVTRTLVRREAVMSSQIEGTKSDLHQLLTYEATHDTGGENRHTLRGISCAAPYESNCCGAAMLHVR